MNAGALKAARTRDYPQRTGARFASWRSHVEEPGVARHGYSWTNAC